MKSTILLTTALFLAVAPSPDSKAVSDLTAGFLSTGANHSLMAAEPTPYTQLNTGTYLHEGDNVEPVMSDVQESL